MIQAKITKNFDLRKIKLDLSRELNAGAKIVKDDIGRGIDNGSQFGQRFAELDPKTAARKGHDRPLIDKGILKDPEQMQVTEATVAKQEVSILPALDRVDVSFWNHFGTDDIPAREHWGVSKRAFNRVMKLIETRIRKDITRIRRATIA